MCLFLHRQKKFLCLRWKFGSFESGPVDRSWASELHSKPGRSLYGGRYCCNLLNLIHATSLSYVLIRILWVRFLNIYFLY